MKQWKLMIFDEADQNLDQEKVEGVGQLLSSAPQQVFVITHNPTIANYC